MIESRIEIEGIHRKLYDLMVLMLRNHVLLSKTMVMAPKIKLADGREMPVVGLGTYARKADPGQFKQAVQDAIDVGYRHIDTASAYHNEEEVGEGINSKIKEGVVKREDLFITTKLWNDSHAENKVVPALKESLRKLKLDYVDLYLVHWPVSVNTKGEDESIDYLETWRGMEQAVSLGLVKSIGVSNFNKEQLERLLKNSQIKPVVNQVEINPSLTQHELVKFCVDNSVQPVAYTPLGLLSEARQEFVGIDVIKTDPRLTAIATKYGKTKAQIVLRYLIQRGIPVIPKSFTKSRIEENLTLFDFELSAEESDVLDSFNLNHRCVPFTPGKKYKNYPY